MAEQTSFYHASIPKQKSGASFYVNFEQVAHLLQFSNDKKIKRENKLDPQLCVLISRVQTTNMCRCSTPELANLLNKIQAKLRLRYDTNAERDGLQELPHPDVILAPYGEQIVQTHVPSFRHKTARKILGNHDCAPKPKLCQKYSFFFYLTPLDVLSAAYVYSLAKKKVPDLVGGGVVFFGMIVRGGTGLAGLLSKASKSRAIFLEVANATALASYKASKTA